MKGQYKWDSGEHGIGLMYIYYSPSSEMVQRQIKCEYMGFIQLCRVGKFDDLGKFRPVNLPDTYIDRSRDQDQSATRYKVETSDAELTDYYFVDVEYNTPSPVYQTSMLALPEREDLKGIGNEMMKKKLKAWQREHNLEDVQKGGQTYSAISWGKIGNIMLKDMIGVTDQYDKDLIVYAVAMRENNEIQVFDGFRWSVEKGKIEGNGAIETEMDKNTSEKQLAMCIRKFSNIADVAYTVLS